MACENTLREWAPLTDLFNKLPIKSQNGLFSQEIKITCLDVLPEFIALGSNVGIVYWYDRKKKNLERLRCENNNIPITVVKIISTVDYMIACGNKTGYISIFQVPKTHPDTLPESLKPKNKQVERYTVSDLHKSPITAIEWAKNGMKLFSGDKNGGVVLTELDFYMHICKSVEILNETYEIIQISYCQQRLLISTTYRSIICQKLDKWKVCQVGKKDRKVLGNYGGIIFQNGFKTNDSVLYCTRPGLRVWISDIEGNVQKTLLFKELLLKECPEVPLINPISRNVRAIKPQKEPSFSTLLAFSENLLVTHNGDVIYILDPQEMIILYTISHLRGVLDIATHKDEIFILEEDRSIVRISHKPETNYANTPNSPTIDSATSPITSSIKDLTTKIQNINIMTAIPPLLENSTILNDESSVIRGEEATESQIRADSLCSGDHRKFDDIGKQEFSDKILYKKTKSKKNSMSASVNSLSSNSSEEKDMSFTRPTIMNLSAVGILPDLRSPESIRSDIEYKERLLADVLNLDTIKFDLDKLNEDAVDGDSQNKEESKLAYERNFKPPSALDSGGITIDRNKISDFRPINRTKPILIQNTQKNSRGEETMSSSKTPDVILGAPDCRNIPKEWKLTNIHLNQGKESTSDTSHTSDDWEII